MPHVGGVTRVMVKDSSDVQLLKDVFGILATFAENTTLARSVQPEKAPLPRVVTLLGIITVSRLVHP